MSSQPRLFLVALAAAAVLTTLAGASGAGPDRSGRHAAQTGLDETIYRPDCSAEIGPGSFVRCNLAARHDD